MVGSFAACKSGSIYHWQEAAGFIDKEGDCGEVTRLVERLREAITLYQVSENCFVATSIAHAGGQISQQQAIDDQITNLTVRTSQFVFFIYADDPLFHQVFFRYRLETSRGDGSQQTDHNVR